MPESEILLASLPDIYDSLVTDLEKMEGGPEIQLKTLPTLSNKIFGLSRGRMYVIGGRTSQGKSTLAMQVAMDVARQGFKVYFLSLEMDQKELMLRMLANICDKDANDIRFHLSKYRKTTDLVRKFFAQPDKFPMLLTYNVGTTMDELNALIADLPNPDLVIVDYVQAIRKVDLDKLSTINNYIVEFRTHCVENNFCGIMVSQINREAMATDKKEPYLWQLKGSGTIEEHADIVLLCHWSHFYDNKIDRKIFKVAIAKNRQGETTTVDLEYIPECYKFREIGTKVYSTPEELEAARRIFEAEEKV